jgi:type I restriction enzyme R subunit
LGGTTFLPFNRGYDGGAGNPPNPRGYRTEYLWKQVWAPDSVLNLVEHFIAEIDEVDETGTPRGRPRLHQVHQAAQEKRPGAGRRPEKHQSQQQQRA